MSLAHKAVWTVLIVGALGCGQGSSTSAEADAAAAWDAGPDAAPGLDAGAPRSDGGAPDGPDAAEAEPDAGAPEPDAGASRVDAGPVRAFPSAVGWGRDATGGRGGAVRKVTNLNDSGPGSLRQAWEAPGKATIIFEVAGTITVSSAIRPTGDKRVAGETAFRNGGQGITIRRSGTYGDSAVSGNLDNSIVRYLRFRPGPGLAPECCGDGLTVLGGSHFVIDHCSFSWSTDEILNLWGVVKYVTLQSCIYSEPLAFSTHQYTTDPSSPNYGADHSKAWLSGGSDTDPAQSTSHVTLFDSLFAHSKDRNPAIGGAAPEAELVNTLLYNWGSFGSGLGQGGTKAVNIINHYAITGVNTSTARYPIHAIDNARIFVKGIYNHKRTTNDWSGVGCEMGCGGDYMTEPAPAAWQAAIPFDYPLKDHPALAAAEIEARVIANAGANLDLDAVDRRLFDEIRNGTGSRIDDPSEVGGWPALSDMSPVPQDADGDGIPDAYESSHGLNAADGADGPADSGDGYTNLEKYLFSLTGGL